MADEGATEDPGGQQPEFVKGQDAAARAGGVKPADQSERATAQTAPDPKSPDGAHSTAADILGNAAERDTGQPARDPSDADLGMRRRTTPEARP